MALTDIISAQLTDLFRIGLIIALVATAFRTRAQMGLALPLALGAVFVAVMIPMTIQNGSDVPQMQLMLAGLVSNAIILAAVLVVAFAIIRARGPR